MKILNSDIVIDWLMYENQSENGKEMPNGMKVNISFSTMGTQGHIDHGCGCKITQDKLGNWLFPCKVHTDKANLYRDGNIIHKNL